MKNEQFKNIYPVLQVLAGDKNARASEAFQILKNPDDEDLKAEAKKVLEILDDYQEPVLPFADVAKEQIDKAFADLDEGYGFPIWSNRLAGTDEDCAHRVREDPDFFLGMSEDDVRQISCEAYEDDKQLLKEELDNVKGVNHLFIKGTIGRWTGPVKAAKIISQPSDLFKLFTGDYFTLYIKDGLLQAENIHHDGTDRFTLYTLPKTFDPENDDLSDIRLDTELVNPVPAFTEYFGWELGPSDAAENSPRHKK